MNGENNNLLAFKKNIYTQNGEDGIIEIIFEKIRIINGTCCEFGAWDGIHLSNCRKLILDGWKAVMIEGDIEKYKDLLKNYKDNKNVIPVNSYVDNSENSLDNILQKNHINELDFLSIDIDGLDYVIFCGLICRPRVICVEVNAGHSPDFDLLLDNNIAKNNIGQSLKKFCDSAKEMGYSLVCYTGNAFFIRKDCMKNSNFFEITPIMAYIEFLNYLNEDERLWLFWVNLALVPPYYKYNNNYLTIRNLNIPRYKTLWVTFKIIISKHKQRVKTFLNKIIGKMKNVTSKKQKTCT